MHRKWKRGVFLASTIMLVSMMPFLILNAGAEEIVATNEWQKVKEGDTIPPGLHVRMDFETGEKWVKLLDENDRNEDLQASRMSTTVILGDGRLEEPNMEPPTEPIFNVLLEMESIFASNVN
jgi:hypothetical protein